MTKSTGRFVMSGMLAVAFALVVAPRAAALQTVTPSHSSEADVVYVGRVNHDGTMKHWVCYDRPGSSTAEWFALTQSGSNLGDSVSVNGGTSSSDTGNDVMLIITSTYSVGGDCAAASGSWSSPLWNGHYIDLDGNAGNDTLYDGTSTGGTNNTQLRGGTGADTLYGYSSIAWLRGGDGNDNVRALHSSSSSDILNGDAGSDCLQDDSNSSSGFDCGADSDVFWYLDTLSKSNCENPTYYCCGIC